MTAGIDVGAERAAVVEAARTWLGTPFAHAAQLRGVGVDCAHLVLAAYEAAGVLEHLHVGEYSPDWFLHSNSRLFRPFLAQHGVRVTAPAAGDVALFRYGRSVAHIALVVDAATVIHAYRGLGVVFGSLAPTHDLSPRLAGFYSPRRWHAGVLEARG